ncbi:molybdopterin converting factor subunit 1 [Ktedonospora formicarum]|nr:molybdopterin converting factor subunit 1 [Ktedonospora formicarum]
MKIHIRYFASLREATGRGDEILELPTGASVSDVRAMLVTRYAGLRAILERCLCAVNRAYVQPEAALHEGDELVFIPPMGGGNAERGAE